jgi:hypothetical protein
MPHQHMPPLQGMYGQPPVQQPPPPQPYYRGPAPPAAQAPPQNVPSQVQDLGIDSTHQVGPVETPYPAVRLIGFKIANVVPGAAADA